ncbi:MAG: prepilin-type N-terminal cleavage/methylation domain-containing protein [Pseudomonadota bacterium]
MRNGKRGFTLLELMVVLALVGVLAAVAAPVATRAIHNAKEAALKEDLTQLRKAVDDYYADHGRYPERLQRLVEARYLRRVPVDPLTGRADSWIELAYDGPGGGVYDVRSGEPGRSRDGQAYSEW